jgi:hypothetical protein
LLYASLRDVDPPLDPELDTVLKTAFLRERLRYDAFRQVLLEVLVALREHALDVVLLRGAAAAETVYPHPALRHTHGIELLVREAQQSQVADRLEALGLAAVAATGELSDDVAGGQLFRHASGVPVHVATTLFSAPRYRASLEELWPETRRLDGERLPARVLGPGDALIDLCGHAPHSPPHERSLWVCDAWLTLRRYPDIAWPGCIAAIRRRGLAPILSVCLDYLSERLGAPASSEALGELRRAADEADALDRDVALFWLRARGGLGSRALLERVGGWRDRARILRWLLFPSARYMAYVEGGAPSPLPLAYARRLASWLRH